MYSPRTQAQSSFSSRRPVNTPPTLRKGKESLNTSLRKSRAQNLSFTGYGNRSISSRPAGQSTQVVQQTAQHTIELYGSTIPVLIIEALTMVDRGTNVSVKLSPSGWSWLICGRRLFIWKYKVNSDVVNSMIHCRELTLPPSDLAHKADLVCVLASSEAQLPSVIAVSPEGIIRFWPNVIHEGSSIEKVADFQGQEFFSLTSIQTSGCILATTTGTLVFITVSASEGQNNIVCRTLKPPQGVLSGIGRRVSSFFFGAVPNQSIESKQLIKVLPDKKRDSFYVVGSNFLQKWEMDPNGADRVVFDVEIDNLIREKFCEYIWSKDNIHMHQVKLWILDTYSLRNSMLLLVAAMNPSASSYIHFAIVNFESLELSPTISSFLPLKHTELYCSDQEERLLEYNCIKGASSVIYVFNKKKVLCISAEGDEIDSINFTGDQIFGAGVYEGLPLLFLEKHGLVSVIGSFGPDLSYRSENLSTYNDDVSSVPEQISDIQSEDKVSQLKAALVLFCRNEISKSHLLVEKLFPSLSSVGCDSALDLTAVEVSRVIIDDYPTNDPRWAASAQGTSFGLPSTSLVLVHHLEDKLKAHEFFINFLKSCHLWDRFTSVTLRDTVVSTSKILCEHAEKVQAAIILRRLHSSYNDILDSAIKIVLQKRNADIPEQLTHQDVFYREVSKMDEIYSALIEYEETAVSSSTSPQDIWTFICSINTIFLDSLHEALVYRNTKFPNYELFESRTSYIPWTSLIGPTGIRSVLLKQHKFTSENSLPLNNDVVTKGALYQQLLDLAEIVLDEYRNQLDSSQYNMSECVALEKKFMNDRSQLILPLMQAEQYERAAALAEKYCDFKTLVEICDKTENQERLQRYMMQFSNQGFSDFVFKWYLDKGKRGKLLVQPPSQYQQLSNFLEGHNGISWLHQLQMDQYAQAQKTLKTVADCEKDYLAKKKTLLSLSKLAALASDEPLHKKETIVDELNSEQDLILYQETLPESVFQAFSLDPDTMRVLTAEELIEFYISDENVDANEYDFKKALELLNYIKKPLDSPELEKLRMHIWCRAILRDNWNDFDTDNPINAIKDTIFFRTIEIAFMQGLDLHDFLPHIPSLLRCDELSSLSDNPGFEFLLQAGYEQLQKLAY